MAISIITPVYNGAAHIHVTLDSLAAQKADFEHIVMDACSKDGTADVVRRYEGRYNVSCISEKDEGHYDAVSKGFGKAKGDILGWINVGDFYTPWTLSVVEKVFARFPEVDWITGLPATNYADENVVGISPVAPVYIRSIIKKGWHDGWILPFIEQESTFWRRSLWEKAGGAALLKGQGRGKGYAVDFHLWKRFAEHAELRTVGTMLAAFSHMKGQISEKFRAEYFKECGVNHVPEVPMKGSTYAWYAYSFLRIPKVIKAHHFMG